MCKQDFIAADPALKIIFSFWSSAVNKTEEEQTKPADGGTEKAFWDAMLNADSRDYKHICARFGVEDTDSIALRVEAKKREREQNKCMVVFMTINSCVLTADS